jgi:preprotein translocase subunit SecE
MTRWIRRTDLLIAYTAVIVTATFLAVLLWH